MKTVVSSVFRYIPTNAKICLWKKNADDNSPEPDKLSTWIKPGISENIDDLVTGYVNLSKQSADLYFGMAPVDGSVKTHSKMRTTRETALGIGALWIDIDIVSSWHKKGNLPPNLLLARGMLDVIPWKPTVVVETGGGIHAYWVLNEFYLINSDQDRTWIEDILIRFQQVIRSSSPYNVDSTHDLARVLRITGSLNHKVDPPFPVEILHETNKTYSVTEIADWLDLNSIQKQTTKQTKNNTRMILKADAMPPFGAFTNLIASNDNFKDSFYNDREDFRDNSPSSYDFSLASIALQSGWPDQEVCNLLLYHRKERNHDQKLDRPDYFSRTISKAREANSSGKANKHTPTSKELDPDEQVDTVDTLNNIKAALDLPDLMQIEKHGTNDSLYVLVFNDSQSVEIGGANAFINQSDFRAKVFEGRNVLILKKKSKVWDRLLTDMSKILVTKEYADTDAVSKLWGLITDYTNKIIVTSKEEAIRRNRPLKLDDGLYIHMQSFEFWLAERTKLQLSSHKLRSWLARAGFERTELRATSSEGDRRTRVRRWFYRAPLSEWDRARGIDFEPASVASEVAPG